MGERATNSFVITVDAVWARVDGPPAEMAFLRQAFSVEKADAEYMRRRYANYDGTIKFLSRQNNTLLSGLVYRLARMIVDQGWTKPQITWPDVQPAGPFTDKIIGMQERDYQIPSVERAIARRRMLMHCPTAGGKTEMGMEIARRIGRRTLWLTHRKRLCKETAERFAAGFGWPLVVSKGMYLIGDDICIAMVPSLYQWICRDEKACRTFLSTFEVLMIDEAHHAAADSDQVIAQACENAHYRYGFTGTPERDPVRALKIEGVTGPTFKVASTMELAEAKWIAKPHIRLLRVRSDTYPAYEWVRQETCPKWRDNPRKLMTLGGKLFRTAYDKGITDNSARNVEIMRVAMEHVSKSEKFLVLCNRRPHAQGLYQAIQLRTQNYPVWGLDGECSDEERDFVIAQFKVQAGGALLIATPFFREGIDIPQIDAGMLAGGGEGEIAVLQSLGRMLRKRPDKNEVLIYDFDDGRRGLPDKYPEKDYLRLHSAARQRLYQREGFVVD